MKMISKAEAYRLLEKSSKYSHSILVSKILRILASRFSVDENEWELVGLLHDLDYDLVRDDPSRHGILASEKLKGRLPYRCLQAIRCHDHRTGLRPETLLDESFIFADSLAIFIEDQGVDSKINAFNIDVALEEKNKVKPWITENIHKYASTYRISIPEFLKSLRNLEGWTEG